MCKYGAAHTANVRLVADSDEVIDFVETMLSELAMMVAVCRVSEKRRARLKWRIAVFEGYLAGQTQQKPC